MEPPAQEASKVHGDGNQPGIFLPTTDALPRQARSRALAHWRVLSRGQHLDRTPAGSLRGLGRHQLVLLPARQGPCLRRHRWRREEAGGAEGWKRSEKWNEEVSVKDCESIIYTRQPSPRLTLSNLVRPSKINGREGLPSLRRVWSGSQENRYLSRVDYRCSSHYLH